MLAGVLAAAACASGGGGRHDRPNEPIRALLSADAMLFVGFDADGDLGTSAAEVDSGIEREFARADANRDGTLQPLEFQNWSNIALGGGQIGPYRLDFDRNVDNAITREEFAAEIRARVRDYDADENGVLSRGDFVRRVGQTRAPSEPRVRAPEPGPTN
jgi:hypothetical protein